MENTSAVRSKNGIWINSQVFREEGENFMKYGSYCSDPWGSPAWYEYWKEQRKRCVEGYEVGGAKITGDHYFYLNFCPIRKVDDTSKKRSSKITGFPDFWDGDFNYFWVREIARNGVADPLLSDGDLDILNKLPEEEKKKRLKELYNSLYLQVTVKDSHLDGGFNLIVGKSRRRGYSFKAGSIAGNNFFTRPDSLTILGAEDKKYLYPNGLFKMAYDHINFNNSNTAWRMPSDVVNKTSQGHIKASYWKTIDGNKTEEGFKSEIISLTFMDNPDAARGKDAYDVFFEEAGAFGTPGLLKQSYAATQDCVSAGGGSIKTGLITIFGTSGDMAGGTMDYSHMFSEPESYGLLAFENQWDKIEGITSFCGFFHPTNQNKEGFYDAQGNSNLVGATQFELDYRQKLLENGATSLLIQQRMQENPLSPSEAFATATVNNFPVLELSNQLKKIQANRWQEIKGMPVQLIRNDKNELVADPILDKKLEPITSYNAEPSDKRGCIVIYEHPIEDAPHGLYKIGYDPVRQDSGTSLASIVVYKSVHRNSYYHSTIVAEYLGRKETTEEIDRIAEDLAIYYNSKIMHENEVTGVKNYFRRRKRLDLLAVQPDKVISKNIKKSKVARVYGCHMNDQLKDAGERYVRDWLLTVLDYDENGNPVTVIDRIYSRRLVEELINYNRKGNYDMVSALFMCMFQVQEEDLDQVHDEKKVNKNAQDLQELMKNMYKKNNKKF